MATAKRLYDEDFYAWTQQQAAVLRDMRGVNNRLDIENLAEEIEDMGRAGRHAIESHATNLLMHLLKWARQPEKRSVSWQITIRNCRREIEKRLRESPSLRAFFERGVAEWYADAREDASLETGLPLDAFPEDMPFPPDRLLVKDWLPEQDADLR